MGNGPFVSLHNHTEFSALDALNDINELFDRAKELDHPSLAITDHGVITGHLDAYEASRRTGVKLIAGVEAYFALNEEDKKSHHMVLLAKNENGYKNILRLNYEAYNNQVSGYMGKMTPRISWTHIENYNQDIICLTACSNGILSKDIVADENDKAIANMLRLKSIFQDRLFLEIQPHSLKTDDGRVDQNKLNDTLIKYSRDYDIPFVATCDAHYLSKDHAKYHDMMLAIKDKVSVDDPNRFRYGVQEMYLKNFHEITDFFGTRIANIAMNNSIKISSLCEEASYLKPSGAILASFPVKDQADYNQFEAWWRANCSEVDLDKAYLRYCCMESFKVKFAHLNQENKKIYWDRVKRELSVMEMRGFSSYILMVADYVNWAKNNNVIVGCGRGSGVGSLVGYILGITGVDPIQAGLLFERFINKEKKAYPDYDIDFSHPDRVRAYLVDKYGQDRVASISNWSTLSPKVVIKDVSRSLNIGGDKSTAFKLSNHITSIMPDEETLEESVDKNKEFAGYMKKYPELYDYASALQGLMRNWGVHAAGVVIAPQPLYEIAPLRIEIDKQTGNKVTATQWDKDHCENFGFIKMDLLGLETLNVISEALRLIKQRHNLDLKIDDIPLDDEDTFKMISRGDNAGVFQLESSLSPLCVKIKPTDVTTVAAINALGRPSCPPEQRKSYIQRRFGTEKIQYTHPRLENALKDTYGISLYEESMMTIAKDCAGWDLNEADNLRKLTKLKGKDPEMALKTEANFIKGCMETSGMTYEQAMEVWDHEIASFSGYGFNRSLIFSQKVGVLISENENWKNVEIQNIKPGSTVLSRNESTGEDIMVKVTNNHYHGKLKLFKITLDSGESVTCTINHKFRTTDGRMLPLHQILKDGLEIVTKQ